VAIGTPYELSAISVQRSAFDDVEYNFDQHFLYGENLLLLAGVDLARKLQPLVFNSNYMRQF